MRSSDYDSLSRQTHSERNVSYKDKFHKTREKYDKVTATHEMYQRELDIANAKIKKLQAENDLLLDAMFLADSSLYDRYFSPPPGSGSPSLAPHILPSSTAALLSLPPTPHLHLSLVPPPPLASASSSGPGPSPLHPPHSRRRSDVGPAPPEDIGPLAHPVGDFDPPYRSSRASAHSPTSSRMNGSSSMASNGHANGVRHRPVERLPNEEMDVVPDTNGRS
ncbi:hypothetical protein B0H34DRAFT_702912 [Crassisporium funariophilum]|nr:hypothetical protein B0H34DRAFT_702912 [Crassisporium funariophilum]